MEYSSHVDFTYLQQGIEFILNCLARDALVCIVYTLHLVKNGDGRVRQEHPEACQ